MASHQTKSIPEALLKLKAALEEGKRDEMPAKSAGKEVHLTQDKAIKPAYKSPTKKVGQPKWENKTVKEGSTKNHNTRDTNRPRHEQASHEKTNCKPKPHIESKPIPLSRNERVKTALTWLCETFPNLFKANDRLPLKIGITQDVAAWIDAHKTLAEPGGDATDIQVEALTPFIPSKTAVRDAITVYTNTPQYQKALLSNDKRYDLDGNEVGIVEEKQKEHADQRNAKIEAAIQVQVEKREALRERRKMIAEAWRAEKEAKKAAESAPDIAT